jgi:hypothetical protein
MPGYVRIEAALLVALGVPGGRVIGGGGGG